MVSIVFTSWILFSTIFSVYCILVEKLQQHEEPEDFYLGDRKMNFITDDSDNRYPGDDNLVEVTKRDAMISSLGEHRAIIEAALDRYGRTYPMKKIPRIARYQIQYSA